MHNHAVAEQPAKRGRPRLPEADTGSNVSTWIRKTDHDRLCALARKHDVTVSQIVRTLIARTLTPPK